MNWQLFGSKRTRRRITNWLNWLIFFVIVGFIPVGAPPLSPDWKPDLSDIKGIEHNSCGTGGSWHSFRIDSNDPQYFELFCQRLLKNGWHIEKQEDNATIFDKTIPWRPEVSFYARVAKRTFEDGEVAFYSCTMSGGYDRDMPLWKAVYCLFVLRWVT